LQVVCVCVFLALAILAVFGQTAHFGFVNCDDNVNVYENPAVEKGLSVSAVGWAFTHTQLLNWIPLTTLSHMLDCQIFGLDAGGHHLVNVLWHAANAILLFLVLREMTGSLWRSAFVAAVFAVHPLRAESVAWVSERKDVLSAFFFLLAIAAYVSYTRTPSRAGYVGILWWFALGLLAKSMVATLPFVLLLLDYWPLGRAREEKRRVASRKQKGGSGEERGGGVPFWDLAREKIPLFALAAGACVVTAQVPGLVISNGQRLPLLERVANAMVSYVVYLRQMVFPAGLAIPYLDAPNGPPPWKVCLAFVGLAAISAALIAWRKKRPYLMVGWLWYVGMLFPVIGIIEISKDAAHADRYTYLPGIGLAVAGTWAIGDWSAGWKHRRAILGGVMTAVIGGLAVCSHLQTSYWRNSQLLWAHTISCTQDNWVAHKSMGDALALKGQRDEAIAQYRKAVEINPAYGDAHYNMGIALLNMGEVDEAIAQYRITLEMMPDFAQAHHNLGNALCLRGQYEEAITHFKQALEIKPDFVEARNNLANTLVKNDKLEEAVAQYREVLEIHPGYLDARMNLALALAKNGKRDEAIAQYRKTLEINPRIAKAHCDLGDVLLQQGETNQAAASFQKALEIQPDYPQAHYDLGNVLLEQGHWEEAIAHYQKALDADPRFVEAHFNLGNALLYAGRLEEAIAEYKKVLELHPGHDGALNNLAWALATCPQTALRDGATALAMAKKAVELTGEGNPLMLRTLAAADAETGSFGLAAVMARRALQLAVEQKNDALAGTLQKEIQLYEADTPVRDSTMKASKMTQPGEAPQRGEPTGRESTIKGTAPTGRDSTR
jgi:tetratricopeptide (TPR) repeat protein